VRALCTTWVRAAGRARGIDHDRQAIWQKESARPRPARVGTALAIRAAVNRLPEPRPARAELAPYDLVRHALEARIELAKERLFADLDQAQKQLRNVAATTARSVARRAVRAVLLGGVVMIGLVTALVLRRQQRRLRLVWK
jgi:hypothetical protein